MDQGKDLAAKGELRTYVNWSFGVLEFWSFRVLEFWQLFLNRGSFVRKVLK